MAGVDFESILRISAFLISLYLAGRICKIFALSPIIGEMIVGILLGPNVADFVPYAEFFKLSGMFGVTLMIFESGMHLDFGMLKSVGLKATVVAVLGTLLPLGMGMLLINALNPEAFPIWPVGLAVGTALAPTSVGMALKMLGEAHQLGETYGQLIVMAAFIDDILSLVGLTMLMEIGKATASGTELSISKVLMPLFLALGFCIIGAMLAYPIRSRKGFVNKYLLCWVGIFPRVIPPFIELVARMISSRVSLLHKVQKSVMDNVSRSTEFQSLSSTVTSMSNVVDAVQKLKRNSLVRSSSAMSMLRGSPNSSDGFGPRLSADLDKANSSDSVTPSAMRPAIRNSCSCDSSTSTSPPNNGSLRPSIAFSDVEGGRVGGSPLPERSVKFISPSSSFKKDEEEKEGPGEGAVGATMAPPDASSSTAEGEGRGDSTSSRDESPHHKESSVKRVMHHLSDRLHLTGAHHHYEGDRLHTLSFLYAPKHSQKGISVLDKHKNVVRQRVGRGVSPRDKAATHHHIVKRLSTIVGDRAHLVAQELRDHIQMGEKGHLHDAHDHHHVIFDLRERVLLMCMFALLLGYGYVANLIGSHLLGAFIAGVSFCWMEHHAALVLWHSQVKRIASWLVRLFFGATVAFAIPIGQMMDGKALAYGMLLGIGPCVGTKVLSGFAAWKDKWIVGFAMVGRGEFAYLVAQTAQAFVLNPASGAFSQYVAGHTGDMVLTSKGSYIYQGAPVSGRMLAGGGGGSDSGGGLGTWCKHCNSTGCDDMPVYGEEYWLAGPACNLHPSECDCQMMMSAQAFSICVWALLQASVMAPIGFGLVLRRRVNDGAKQELQQQKLGRPAPLPPKPKAQPASGNAAAQSPGFPLAPAPQHV